MDLDRRAVGGVELGSLLQAGQRLAHAHAAYQALSLRALLQFQVEGSSFLRRRVVDDLELISRLTRRDDFVDAFDIVANFVQNAASDYADEIGRLASIGARVAAETAVQVRREARTTADDMAAATLAP